MPLSDESKYDRRHHMGTERIEDRTRPPLFPPFVTRSIATEHDALQRVAFPSWAKGRAYNAAQVANRTNWESFLDGLGPDFVSNEPVEP